MLSKVANVIDCEHDKGKLIEIGLTTVNLNTKEIIKTYSFPFKVNFALSKEVTELTGWTNSKLAKQGLETDEIIKRLTIKHGFCNRLLITDHSDEIPFIEEKLRLKLSPHRFNVSLLYEIFLGWDDSFGLELLLKEYNIPFEGQPHRASDDSYNIAKLFCTFQYTANKMLNNCSTISSKLVR